MDPTINLSRTKHSRSRRGSNTSLLQTQEEMDEREWNLSPMKQLAMALNKWLGEFDNTPPVITKQNQHAKSKFPVAQESAASLSSTPNDPRNIFARNRGTSTAKVPILQPQLAAQEDKDNFEVLFRTCQPSGIGMTQVRNIKVYEFWSRWSNFKRSSYYETGIWFLIYRIIILLKQY